MNKKTIISFLFCSVAFVGVVLMKQAQDNKKPDSSSNTTKPEELQSQPIAPDKETAPRKELSDIIPEKQGGSLNVPKVIITAGAIPQSLTVVMGISEGKNYSARIEALQGLGKNLSEQEVQSLYVLLNRKRGEDDLRPGQINALKDSVCNLLEKQKRKPDKLAHNLIAMYYDQEHDNVWRDYCVQHLGSFLPKVADPGEQQKVVDLFWKATEEKKITIGGTSLISMFRNLNNPLIDKNNVARKALELSKDPTCGEATKITALQICAKLDEKDVLPTARKIAASGGSVPLRMSAIAAVGTLGDESDRPMLEKYSKSSDVRLRKSAQSALGRLGK